MGWGEAFLLAFPLPLPPLPSLFRVDDGEGGSFGVWKGR